MTNKRRHVSAPATSQEASPSSLVLQNCSLPSVGLIPQTTTESGEGDSRRVKAHFSRGRRHTLFCVRCSSFCLCSSAPACSSETTLAPSSIKIAHTSWWPKGLTVVVVVACSAFAHTIPCSRQSGPRRRSISCRTAISASMGSYPSPA